MTIAFEEHSQDLPELVLTRAAIRAARRLGLSNRELGAALGLSASTVSRSAARDRALPGAKPLELAALVVHLYRAIDALSGGDDAIAAEWMRRDNVALGAVPADLTASVTGLATLIAYLDARRSAL